MIQTVEHAVDYEKRKAEHDKELSRIVLLEMELLSRTVFVGNVLPLDKANNLAELRRFMEREYGRVQVCVQKKIRKNDRYPVGKVRFVKASDAQKIFQGKTLLEVCREQSKSQKIKVPCASVGYKGQITVWPQPHSPGMLEDEELDTHTVMVETSQLSLGHWFPKGEDACVDLPSLKELCESFGNRWVEKAHSTSLKPTLKFNWRRGVVEIEVTQVEANEGLETDFHNILYDLWDMNDMNESRTFASFRFKDLVRPIELCRCEKHSFYLIFSLKHPPRLYSEVLLTERKTRETELGDLRGEVFGECLGYKLLVSEVEILKLFSKTKIFAKLQRFGVFPPDLFSEQMAETFVTESVVREDVGPEIEDKLSVLGNSGVGFRLRSVLDNYTCCRLDMLNDTTEDGNPVDLFDLIGRYAGSPESVEKVRCYLWLSPGMFGCRT
jgi:hypothetical protein